MESVTVSSLHRKVETALLYRKTETTHYFPTIGTTLSPLAVHA